MVRYIHRCFTGISSETIPNLAGASAYCPRKNRVLGKGSALATLRSLSSFYHQIAGAGQSLDTQYEPVSLLCRKSDPDICFLGSPLVSTREFFPGFWMDTSQCISAGGDTNEAIRAWKAPPTFEI
jgi:hypothetical protein